MNVSPQIDRLLLIKDSSQPAVHDHDEYEVEGTCLKYCTLVALLVYNSTTLCGTGDDFN